MIFFEESLGLVLLDLVLGYGAHADPAAGIVRALVEASEDRPLVVASVTGTDADLGRGKAAALRGIHGVEHVLHQRFEILFAHGIAGLGQPGIGPEDKRQHAHARARSRFIFWDLRVIIWRFIGPR